MKKYLILYKLLFIGLGGYGQLNIGSGTQWITNGNTTVVLQNVDLVNNGSISASAGSFKFTGTQNSTINGSNMPLFNILEISKTNNSKILLGRNIGVGSSINFADFAANCSRDIWGEACCCQCCRTGGDCGTYLCP